MGDKRWAMGFVVILSGAAYLAAQSKDLVSNRSFDFARSAGFAQDDNSEGQLPPGPSWVQQTSHLPRLP